MLETPKDLLTKCKNSKNSKYATMDNQQTQLLII